jgi:hypothetical protein
MNLITLIAVFLAWSLACGLMIVVILLRKRRQKALDTVARQFGLDFAPVDLLGLIDHSFDLFNRADSARTRNVVWGVWGGVGIEAGDLSFEPAKRGPMEMLRAVSQQFSVAFTEIPAWLPHLKIQRDEWGGAADDLGLDRIRLESHAFNRTFNVTCADREFAYQFLDTRMLLWFLDVARYHPVEFEVKGRKLLAYMPQLKPGELPVLFGLAKGFRDRVPRMVLREYAIAGA